MNKLMRLLTKIFGTKTVSFDVTPYCTTRVVAYKWRGRYYIEYANQEVAKSNGRRTK